MCIEAATLKSLSASTMLDILDGIENQICYLSCLLALDWGLTLKLNIEFTAECMSVQID